MGLVLQCIAFAVAGFLQEVCLVVYHRATGCNRKLLATAMTVSITIMSLLVMAHITHQILAFGGFASFIYVLVFALGKGAGAYVTLSWWERYQHKNAA